MLRGGRRIKINHSPVRRKVLITVLIKGHEPRLTHDRQLSFMRHDRHVCRSFIIPKCEKEVRKRQKKRSWAITRHILVPHGTVHSPHAELARIVNLPPQEPASVTLCVVKIPESIGGIVSLNNVLRRNNKRSKKRKNLPNSQAKSQAHNPLSYSPHISAYAHYKP
jgi:hypothetical protein